MALLVSLPCLHRPTLHTLLCVFILRHISRKVIYFDDRLLNSWSQPKLQNNPLSAVFHWLIAQHTSIYWGRGPHQRRSQWPRVLKRRFADVRLLRLWVRIPRGSWMSVCCDCFVLLVRGLCDKLITRREESHRLWCVVVCDLETSWMRRPWPWGGGGVGGGGCCVKNKQRAFINAPFRDNIIIMTWKK